MSKLYRLLILLIVFVFLTTYTTKNFENSSKSKIFLFKIKNIEIKNNQIIDEKEIIKRLKNLYEKNILFIKKNEVEKPIINMDFLDKIEVKKKYPSKILINIYETKPLAIIYKKDKKYLLDSKSKITNLNKKIDISNLPIILGDGAELDFINFSKKLEDNNFPKEKIKNYFYFKNNRWDLQLISNQIIKFPEKERDKAIRQSIDLLKREDFKNYNIIDLRIKGKIIAN